jgi:glucokinase
LLSFYNWGRKSHVKTFAIGIDIGGTKTAIGLVDRQGQVKARHVIPTNLAISPTQMIQEIIYQVGRMLKGAAVDEEQVLGIGIGAPGPLDTKAGRISCPPNLPEWVDVAIVAEFEKHFPMPIAFENDATAAALAEKFFGAAQECQDFVYMTISTGIGAGLFLNGQLVTGARGNAGDIGHMMINPSYGTCICGQEGCFEWIASGTAISRKGSEIMGQPLSTKEIFQLYEEGHSLIVPYIEDVFRHIGIGCVSLINAFDPEKIVLGGGVTEVGAPLFEAVQRYVSRYALNPSGRKTPIVRAGLKQDAGLIGAASLIFGACHHPNFVES